MHPRPAATAGCRSDEDRLVRDHLVLVQHLVSEVVARVPQHVSRDELTSAGLLGLAQAARSWDPARGVTFDGYARSRIRGALLDELRGRDWASRGVRARARQVASATDELRSDLGRTPTAAEVGTRVGIATADIARLEQEVHRATVLDFDTAFLQAEHHGWLATDERGPAELLLAREAHAYLLDAVVCLPERLRRVVVGYFFDERRLSELAQELGVTESRISQMRAEALVLLRAGMNAQLHPEVYAAEQPDGRRAAQRRTAYVRSVAAASDHRDRLAADPVPLRERVAHLEAVSG